MRIQYMYLAGAFCAGALITLFFMRSPHEADQMQQPALMQTAQDMPTKVEESTAQPCPPALHQTTYASHIVGNETRHGGADIANTEITGTLSVYGALTAYQIKAHAANIYGAATITDAHLEDALLIHGGLKGRTISARSISAHGGISLVATCITDTLKAYGGLTADTISARAAKIGGAAHITNGRFSEQLQISGKALLTDSETPEIVLTPNGNLSWIPRWVKNLFSSHNNTPTLTLVNSRAGKIRVDDSQQDKPIIIKLTKNSIVGGTISFSGMPGIVIIDSSSKVKGDIINGTTQAEKQQ